MYSTQIYQHLGITTKNASGKNFTATGRSNKNTAVLCVTKLTTLNGASSLLVGKDFLNWIKEREIHMNYENICPVAFEHSSIISCTNVTGSFRLQFG